LAGWAVLAGIAIRVVVLRLKGDAATGPMEVLAAGFIGGDALFGFFGSVLRAKPPIARWCLSTGGGHDPPANIGSLRSARQCARLGTHGRGALGALSCR